MIRYIFLIIIISGIVLAEDHYVTQNGAGSRDGSSPSNAFSVSNFNDASKWDSVANSDNGRIGPGDTVFFSGTFSTEIYVAGSGISGNPITLDGYEPDDTRFMHLSEASGRAVFDFNGARAQVFQVQSKHHLVFQDFEITDCGSGGGFSIQDRSSNILIRRNFIHDEIHNGISVGRESSYVTIGGTRGQGNVIKNVGADTGDEDIAIASAAHDVIVSYNHLYGEGGRGIDGVMVEVGNNLLIEHNTIHGHNNIYGHLGEDGIDLKKDSTRNVIIRYNNIYDHDYQTCITVQSGSDHVYVYGNRCSDSENGLLTGDDPANDEVYFFSNIVYEIEEKGVQLGAQGSAGNVHLYNNVVSKGGMCTDYSSLDYCRTPNSPSSSGWVNVRVSNVDSVIAKNNILYKSKPYETDYYPYLQVSVDKNEDTYSTFDNNVYYWPGRESILFWGDSGFLTLAEVRSRSGNGLPQEQKGVERDPGLVNAENNDFRVASESSSVFGSGVSMGTGTIAVVNIHGTDYPVYWDDALHPDTDWTTIPPTVIPARQGDYGAWEIGPYVYDGGTSPTCAEQGYFCCQQCAAPVTGTGCSGTCCASACEGGYLAAETIIEAEAGALSGPMQTHSDSSASGGSYIASSTNNQGTATFTFEVDPGTYHLRARIKALDAGSDSFFCYLDGVVKTDWSTDAWNTLVSEDWKWIDVTIRGTGGLSEPQYDPMTWNLNGVHTFTIQGRENGAMLDQIMLTATCTEMIEISGHIDEWKSGRITLSELVRMIKAWQNC